MADGPRARLEPKLVAEAVPVAAGDLGVLDRHPEGDDLAVGDVPVADGGRFEAGLDDHGVGLGQQADLVRLGVSPVHLVAGRARWRNGVRSSGAFAARAV